jgi:hypothetical protein
VVIGLCETYEKWTDECETTSACALLSNITTTTQQIPMRPTPQGHAPQGLCHVTKQFRDWTNARLYKQNNSEAGQLLDS